MTLVSVLLFIWKAFLILLAIAFVAFIIYTYICYKLTIMSFRVLKSASRMQTGNDLAEQYEEVEKEKVPNYFQFYWMEIKRLMNDGKS